MGCPGCLLSEREKQQQIEQVSNLAKQYADNNKKLAVLYWKSDKQVDYMDAEQARAAGITPIKFVSWL
ncbi:MAG: hypothetical protein DIU61_009620 [Bacteroidota bacterium]|jgi:hypothetical protein